MLASVLHVAEGRYGSVERKLKPEPSHRVLLPSDGEGHL